MADIMEPQVFDFAEDDDDEERPDLEFTVKYKRRQYTGEGDDRKPTGKWTTEEEKFRAHGQVPAGLTLSTVAAFAGRGSDASQAIINFLHKALVDGDNVRFLTLIEDQDTRFQMKHLSKIVDWLLTAYGERPTKSA